MMNNNYKEAALACLNAMEIQEKRQTEEFHLSSAAFFPIWENAKKLVLEAKQREEKENKPIKTFTDIYKKERAQRVLIHLQRLVENKEKIGQCSLQITGDGIINSINLSSEPYSSSFGLYIEDDGSLDTYMSGY
jgi:hypothetical protein